MAEMLQTRIAPAACPRCGAASRAVEGPWGQIARPCPSCRDWLLAEDQRRAANELNAARAQADEQSGFPRRFRGVQLHAMSGTCEDHRHVLAACDRYLETFRRHEAEGTGMLFIGTPGTGKTTMACAVAQGVRERYGIDVKYARATDVVDLAFDRARSQDSLLAIESAGLLVLDELGAEGSHEFPARVLASVLDRRYADQRPTILVSNLPDLPGDTLTLWEHLGAPVSDRVKSTMQILGCAWASLRHEVAGGRDGR